MHPQTSCGIRRSVPSKPLDHDAMFVLNENIYEIDCKYKYGKKDMECVKTQYKASNNINEE